MSGSTSFIPVFLISLSSLLLKDEKSKLRLKNEDLSSSSLSILADDDAVVVLLVVVVGFVVDLVVLLLVGLLVVVVLCLTTAVVCWKIGIAELMGPCVNTVKSGL